MKVFVSWSGDQSKAVASSLKNWLPFVFNGLNVWMSDQDIQAGTQWGQELGKALSECKLGILCLTPENLQSRWITFEAGALSTALSGARVIPYRFQLRRSDISPPLSQFQDEEASEQGTFKLVSSINDALERPWSDDESLRLVFHKWWPDMRAHLDSVQGLVPTQVRSDRDLLEEILDLARQTGIRDLNAVLIRLLSAPNIRRVEVAPKQVGGNVTDRLALRITVVKKLPLSEIPRDQLIPSAIFGMPTDVVEDA